jgi:hypothetical protein
MTQDQDIKRRCQLLAEINLTMPRTWYHFRNSIIAVDFVSRSILGAVCCERQNDGTYHIRGPFTDAELPIEYYVGRYKTHDSDFIAHAEKLLRTIVLQARQVLTDSVLDREIREDA